MYIHAYVGVFVGVCMCVSRRQMLILAPRSVTAALRRTKKQRVGEPSAGVQERMQPGMSDCD